MANRDSRTISKEGWNVPQTVEGINCGSLQRIADATEKMASSYDAVRQERDRYQGYYKDSQARNAAKERTISSLRGTITKLKKRLAAKPEDSAQ